MQLTWKTIMLKLSFFQIYVIIGASSSPVSVDEQLFIGENNVTPGPKKKEAKENSTNKSTQQQSIHTQSMSHISASHTICMPT